jgi:hypothetical protein
MQSCQVCGRSFDPLGFQVVVPELGSGFDRLECAHSARASAGPAARIAAAPLLAPTQPVAAAAAPAAATAAAVRGTLVPVPATLGLLAAGTAAAVVLWVNVLGADPSSFSLGPFSPPPAFGHQTIKAEVAPTPPPAQGAGAPTEQQPIVTVAKAVSVPSIPAALPVVARRANASPVARPARFTTARPTGKSNGKGHGKRGQGHAKHSTGNGNGGGASTAVHGQGKSQGHGNGKSEH